MASWVLGAEDRDREALLGEITLHPHQRVGIERVRRMLDQYGGALLADDVGLGKTFMALAIARAWRNTVVVAPAALRDTWNVAARQAHVAVQFVSVESLGRGGAPPAAADFVVIDEAHHLRARKTRRFSAAATLCGRAKVLLMSATPIQNRLDDLRTILSLFLGADAFAMSPDDLARLVVRRVDDDVASSRRFALPTVREPIWLHASEDVDCLDRLEALPPPLPPADGDTGGVLLMYTLARQWASSRAALRAALRRRLARARAMEDALLAGRLPSRAELRLWCCAEGAQQLTFPELIVRAEAAQPSMLLEQVHRHADAVRDLVALIDQSPSPDIARAETLYRTLGAHPGERVIAFSEYTDTVVALYRALAPTTRLAMLTHGGGRVAGGRLSRRELLERFSPGASSRTAPSDRIDLLLTTDVLSEGVNLQDASVVVHLDLTWNPARLEQRVGRLRRAGAARDAISVYMFAPPAPAERLLQIEQRLRLKLGIAARSLGVAGAILPGLASISPAGASAPREERIARAVLKWRGAETHSVDDLPPVSAAVRSNRDATIACVRCGDRVSLIVLGRESITDDRGALDEALRCANGEDVQLDASELTDAQQRVERWLRHRSVAHVVDLPALRVARSRRALLHRVDTIARRASRHSQPQLAPLVRAARSVATATLSAGAERVLEQIVSAPLTDEALLRAMREFSALHARPDGNPASQLLALLVLRRDVSGSRSRSADDRASHP
jgi:hypothetical protein